MLKWFKKNRKNTGSQIPDSSKSETPKPVTPFIGKPKEDGNNYFMQHRWGAVSHNFPLELLEEYYDELAAEDIEHVCVSLQHESAWSLSAFPSGDVVYENVEEGEPRHMTGLSKEKTVKLWKNRRKVTLVLSSKKTGMMGISNLMFSSQT